MKLRRLLRPLRTRRAVRRARLIRQIAAARYYRWAVSWVYDRGVIRPFDLTELTVGRIDASVISVLRPGPPDPGR